MPLAWLLIAAAPGLGLRRRIARACARLALALTGLTPRLTGAQQLAGLDAPLIVVANHASYLDALILTAVLPPRFAYVAKQELLRKPLAAIPLRRLGSAFVERFDSARGAEDTRALEERLRAGESMVFFPEGTFKREPGLLPFRMGAFMLAARTGAPVLPVSLIGTRTLLRGEVAAAALQRPRSAPRHAAVGAGRPLASGPAAARRRAPPDPGAAGGARCGWLTALVVATQPAIFLFRRRHRTGVEHFARSTRKEYAPPSRAT